MDNQKTHILKEHEHDFSSKLLMLFPIFKHWYIWYEWPNFESQESSYNQYTQTSLLCKQNSCQFLLRVSYFNKISRDKHKKL